MTLRQPEKLNLYPLQHIQSNQWQSRKMTQKLVAWHLVQDTLMRMTNLLQKIQWPDHRMMTNHVDKSATHLTCHKTSHDNGSTSAETVKMLKRESTDANWNVRINLVCIPTAPQVWTNHLMLEIASIHTCKHYYLSSASTESSTLHSFASRSFLANLSARFM